MEEDLYEYLSRKCIIDKYKGVEYTRTPLEELCKLVVEWIDDYMDPGEPPF